MNIRKRTPEHMPRGYAVLARHHIFYCSPESRLLEFLSWRLGIPRSEMVPRTRFQIPERAALEPNCDHVDRADVARWVREVLFRQRAWKYRERKRDRRARHVRSVLHLRNQLERAALQASPRDAVYRTALFDVTDQLIRTFTLEVYRKTIP